jgi:hypothetical protein
MGKGSDAENDGSYSGRITARWSAIVEYSVRVGEIADRVVNRDGYKQTQPRHAIGPGRHCRRRFANRSIMVTAVVTSCAANLWT